MNDQTNTAAAEAVDVAIIGAGVAGLSVALFLTRARRRTLVFDGGPTRYSVAQLIHEFPGQEAITPTEFQGRKPLHRLSFRNVLGLKYFITEEKFVRKKFRGLSLAPMENSMFGAAVAK